jgi:hypothetical protein
MVNEVWGQKDHPSGLNTNTVQILALSFHITGHHAPPGPIFIPKQDGRTSFMIPNHPGVWKVYLVKVDFPPYRHPFCWFSLREMGQNGVSGQVMLRFAPFFCCNDICYWNVDDSYKNDANQVSGWWDMREWWWKVGFTPRQLDVCPGPGWFHVPFFSCSGC